MRHFRMHKKAIASVNKFKIQPKYLNDMFKLNTRDNAESIANEDDIAEYPSNSYNTNTSETKVLDTSKNNNYYPESDKNSTINRKQMYTVTINIARYVIRYIRKHESDIMDINEVTYLLFILWQKYYKDKNDFLFKEEFIATTFDSPNKIKLQSLEDYFIYVNNSPLLFKIDNIENGKEIDKILKDITEEYHSLSRAVERYKDAIDYIAEKYIEEYSTNTCIHYQYWISEFDNAASKAKKQYVSNGGYKKKCDHINSTTYYEEVLDVISSRIQDNTECVQELIEENNTLIKLLKICNKVLFCFSNEKLVNDMISIILASDPMPNINYVEDSNAITFTWEREDGNSMILNFDVQYYHGYVIITYKNNIPDGENDKMVLKDLQSTKHLILDFLRSSN